MIQTTASASAPRRAAPGLPGLAALLEHRDGSGDVEFTGTFVARRRGRRGGEGGENNGFNEESGCYVWVGIWMGLFVGLAPTMGWGHN